MDYFIGFIVLLGILIFVHEFGHFIIAKLVGVKVLKFSLGFVSSIVKRKWGETEYMIGWLPLGGYVKLLGEDPESDETVPEEEKPRAFTSKPLWARVAIVIAGPLSNYLLAVVLLSAGYMAGWPVLTSDIGNVVDGTPAKEAGLKSGDRITAIDGHSVWRWQDMRRMIEKSPGRELSVKIDRDGLEKDLRITPELSDQPGIFGDPIGRIGVGPAGTTVTLGPVEAVYEGARFTGELTGLVVVTLVNLVRGKVSAKALSGPITILQASGESFRAGLFNFVFLLSYISINLAIINLLPIPILDGGHLMFFAIEAVIRRPVTGRIREVAVQAGFLFIVFLMGLVIYNDISRIITQGWSLAPGP
ncbi:MAG: RIP metalloprotease RseP [Desulfomonilaceae bacterium]|nr:RIP metalloprotease RseP [Desulfomonilaceae bacterium]